MKVPKPSLKFAAVLLFVAAAGLWPLPDPTKFYSMWEMGLTGNTIHKRFVPLWEQISEADARQMYRAIDQRRKELVASGQMDVWKNFQLQEEVRFVMDRVVTKYDLPGREYECEYECVPNIMYEGQTLTTNLAASLNGYCGTDEGRQVCLELSERMYGRSRQIQYLPAIRAEVLSTQAYKLTRSMPFVLVGLALLIISRGRRLGWSFERLVGHKILQFAAYSAAIAFSFCGQAAIAQQIAKKAGEKRQFAEKTRKKDTGNPADTLTVWLFSDSDRDRQGILQYSFAKGPVLLSQTRETTDRKSLTSTVAGGWRFAGKRLDATVAAGPSYNLKTGEYGSNIQVFVMNNLNTRFFRFSSLVKLFVPTDGVSASGSRHVQTLRGPPERTPRWLQGVYLQMENWHTNAKGGYWLEHMAGPAFNVGEVIGRKKGFWSNITVWPYYDFCRPQPGHNRGVDLRVQYKQTFSFAR